MDKNLKKWLNDVFLLIVIMTFGQFVNASEILKQAPDFTLKSEGSGKSGQNIKLSDYKGQVVLVNFWASWCAPCRKEMPLLEDLYTLYKDLGMVILGINVESDSTKALEFLQKVPVSFPILFDTESQVTERYGVDAMPTTVIIDRDGYIRMHHRGYKDGYEDLYEDKIKTLVSER